MVALIVSLLVDVATQRSADAARSEAETAALGHLASTLRSAEDPLPQLLHDLRTTFGLDGVSIVRRDGMGWHSVAEAGPAPPVHR